MTIVVSSTTPLSAYLKAGKEDIPRELFGSLLIPGAVADELDRGKRWFGEWRERVSWIEVRVVEATPLLELLCSELDRGEAEALVLAVESQADLVLMDEAAGRSKARSLTLTTMGSVGMALLAERRGIVPTAFPIVVELKERGGLWLSDRFLAEIERKLKE